MLNHVLKGLDLGRPVVFLHGWGGSLASFAGLERFLSAEFCTLNLDFYGFGQSPAPAVPLTVNDYAEGVRELIRKYKLSGVTLVAHSFGGRVAAKLANDAEISKIVLIDAAGLRPRRAPKYYLKVVAYKLKKRLKMNVSGAGSADWRALAPEMRRTFSNIVGENLKGGMKKIKKPTLIIWGEKDAETPLYMAKKLQKLIEGAGLVTFPESGHFSYIDRHAECVKIISNFVREDGGALTNLERGDERI